MTARQIVLSGALAVVLLLFGGGAYAVVRYKTYYAPSGSMEPTVRTHQLFVVDQFAYHTAAPVRNDVILFVPPALEPNPLFKRVVAVPGDQLAIRRGRTLVNGTQIADPFAASTPYELVVRSYGMWVDGTRLEPSISFVPPRAEWTAPDTVPRGCYVALGDNRANSLDSHVWGFFCPGKPLPDRPDVRQALLGRAMVP